MEAESTALTGDRVNLEIINGAEATYILTQTTLSALLFINNGNLSTPELVLLFNRGVEQQVKVGGIYIAVSQYLTLS